MAALGVTCAWHASASDKVPWTQERIEAVVRVEVTYPGYARPQPSTGFLVKGYDDAYYVIVSTHGLSNEYVAPEQTPPSSDCVPLKGGRLELIQGERAANKLKHNGCVISVDRDISLIPLVGGQSGLPTLEIRSQAMHRDDVLYLAWKAAKFVGTNWTIAPSLSITKCTDP